MLHTQIVSVVGEKLIAEDSEYHSILSGIFHRLAELGVHLRTSGAIGIEALAIESYKNLVDKGVITPQRVNIFIPWQGYNTMMHGYPGQVYTTLSIDNFKRASSLAKVVTPMFTSLLSQTQKQFAKVPLVMFGRDLNRPSNFLITIGEKSANGGFAGPSGVAIRIAKLKNIPVFDFSDENDIDVTLYELRKYLRSKGYPIVSEEEALHVS